MVGEHTYLKSGWNVMDFFLVVISLVDYFVTQFSEKKSSFLSVLKVFRALRTLRPLRFVYILLGSTVSKKGFLEVVCVRTNI